MFDYLSLIPFPGVVKVIYGQAGTGILYIEALWIDRKGISGNG